MGKGAVEEEEDGLTGPGHDHETEEAMTTDAEDATNLLPTRVFRVKCKISSLKYFM